MYKILHPDRDGYITNRVVDGKRVLDANVGFAGTLDIFKLYDITRSGSTPNTELSRVLMHFDLSPLKNAVESGVVDISHSSFWCRLQLNDVYGGQPTPNNFTLTVFPLSASFSEGFGKNISYYSDVDAANWLSSSTGVLWNLSGSELAGTATSMCDYITSSISLANTMLEQKFPLGTEDLSIDVTSIISATLSGELPDSGFRLSLSPQMEQDTNTYFVKRFASRHAFDETKRPRLVFGYDDSTTDDTQNLTFDIAGRIRLYNSVAGKMINLKSGGVDVVGLNCLALRLEPAIVGMPSFYFTGSQAVVGINYSSGSYYADVQVPSTGSLSQHISQSGSIKFRPIWTSLDSSVTFTTGSSLTISKSTASNDSGALQKYIVTVNGIKQDYRVDETVDAQVNVFNYSSPLLKVVKVPVETPSIVFPDSYYRVRDVTLDKAVVPFDDVKNSTRLSSDGSNMYFKLDADVLNPERTYVIDIMIKSMGMTRVFENASPVFRVVRNPSN